MAPLILLSGPAGAGKSSTAAAWAARGTTPRAVIDVDELRLLIRAGVALAHDGWTAETERQWGIGTELWMAMARVYHRHDVGCIVPVYAPPTHEDPWQHLYDELGLVRIILFPTFEACQQRNRDPRRGHVVAEDDLWENYDGFAWCVNNIKPDCVIDNSNLTLQQTVDAIESVRHSPRFRDGNPGAVSDRAGGVRSWGERPL